MRTFLCWKSRPRLKDLHRKIFSSISSHSGSQLENKWATIDFITKNTEITRNHLTPEIRLHLITDKTPLWHAKMDACPFADPFWGFYWPGGQGLARYILDNHEHFKNKTILDIGCGCGATSIACTMAGASEVIANDLDPVSLVATEMNGKLNNISLTYEPKNVIGCNNTRCDVVLLGDMFYDSDFAEKVFHWVRKLIHLNKDVFVGDPGRLPFTSSPVLNLLTLVSEYDLPENSQLENNGMTTARVWKSF